jgi:hypothetical protein
MARAAAADLVAGGLLDLLPAPEGRLRVLRAEVVQLGPGQLIGRAGQGVVEGGRGMVAGAVDGLLRRQLEVLPVGRDHGPEGAGQFPGEVAGLGGGMGGGGRGLVRTVQAAADRWLVHDCPLPDPPAVPLAPAVAPGDGGAGPAPATLTCLRPMFTCKTGRASLRTTASVRMADR